MIYREYPPSPEYRDVVERFWSVEDEGSSDAPVEPILPDGCPEVVFNLADRFERILPIGGAETQASVIVSGQIRSRLLIRPKGRVNLFGVRFQPYAAATFLGVGMSSLTDHIVPLDSVLGQFATDIESCVAEASTVEERIAVIETAILSRKIDGNPTIAAAVTELITRSGGRMPVKLLAAKTGIGERRLERIFDKFVGVSPKVFSRIVRFQALVRKIENAEAIDLLDTALGFGYFDQSHMIHEFKEFAGTSPIAYFEQTHRLSDLLTS